MGVLFKSTTDRIITGFVIAWFVSHQSQLVTAENQLSVIVGILFALFPISWIKSKLLQIEEERYAMARNFLMIELELLSTGLLWTLITIVSNLYNESLKPFVNLDSVYRTLVAMIIIGGVVTLIEDFPRPLADKAQ